MNGGKMSNTDESVVQEERLEALERENAILKQNLEGLKGSVERLKQINAEQLSRLVDQTLLRAHADSLQAQLSKKDNE